MWGQLRIMQGGHLKIRGTGKNSNMRGIQNFLGVSKNRGGQGFQGACYRGVFLSTFFTLEMLSDSSLTNYTIPLLENLGTESPLLHLNKLSDWYLIFIKYAAQFSLCL